MNRPTKSAAGTRHRATVLIRPVMLLLMLSLLLAACGGDGAEGGDTAPEDTPTETTADDSAESGDTTVPAGDDLPPVVFQGFPFDVGSMPAIVMREMDIDTQYGFRAEFLEVDPGAAANTLLIGESDIAMEQDAINMGIAQASGQDAVAFYGNLNQTSSIVVSTDSDYEDPTDLVEGVRVGHPGLDSGTLSTVALMVSEIYGVDPYDDYDLRQAGFGALPDVLAAEEIDAMINAEPFALRSVEEGTGRYIFQSKIAWEERTGGWSPWLTNLTARVDWLEENSDLALNVLAAWKEAAQIVIDSDYEILLEDPYASLLLSGMQGEEELAAFVDFCVDFPCLATSWTEEDIEDLNEYLELVVEQGILLEAMPEEPVAVILEDFLGGE